MITSRARLLYPSCEQDDYFSSPSYYAPILKSFGTILAQVDDEDYSGDSRVLYEKDGRYGFLIFDWGSFSGCDALQGCDNYDDIDELIQSLESSIKWFDSLDDAKCYVSDEETRKGNFYYYDNEKWSEFRSKVLACDPLATV